MESFSVAAPLELIALVINSRLPQMIGLECDRPGISVLQRTFLSAPSARSAFQESTIFPSATPSESAPRNDGQLTVPSYVLQMLPAGTTQLGVKFYPNPQLFTAPGLDVGVATMDPVPVEPITVTFK